MLSFGKASKQTFTMKICQMKSHQLQPLKFLPLKREKICGIDVTKEDGLLLKGWIPQYGRVDNHSRDMDKFLLFIK